jgi:signal transduction histidine kinase
MTLEVDPEYMILADKNKVSQILINLIANALDAMTSENTDKNHISVTAQCTESCIRLCVTDTGCGIDKADLTRIFNNGFSTKSTGHGFGLHSSANYMTEMKGSMLAESDGEGCGATFILTFQRPHATTDGAISQENSV